jgi:hypothetical protein
MPGTDKIIKASSKLDHVGVFVIALGGVTICATLVFRWHDAPERFPSTDYGYGLVIGLALCVVGALMRRPVARPAVTEDPGPNQ